MKILLIVKRFGLCGGMEEYVYRLSHELIERNVPVSVLCEKIMTSPKNLGIRLFELGEGLKKPRWLSHLFFARKVNLWVTKENNSEYIIHSHERIKSHHITTIHSTLFNFPRGKFNFPSFRKLMNEYIEKRELTSNKVKCIVPVSQVISDQISQKYPHLTSKINKPVHPGVTPLNIEKKKYNPDQPVLGFMGTEWKRKGLPKVINIWRAVRKQIPTAQLCLAGFPVDEKIGLLEDEMKFVQILGYIKEKEDFFGRIDILLHPAKKEAFGMVIAEALSLGIPAVCSKECGISSSINKLNMFTLSESDENNDWVNLILKLLNQYDFVKPPCELDFPWTNVSEKMLEIYSSINRFEYR